MAKKTDVVVVEQSVPNVSIEAVIQNAIDKGVPVDVMERLLAMRRELKQEAAKEAYDRAMAAFQADCPIITKNKIVRDRQGQEIYSYAPIESIVQQVSPYLQKHGFSYSTSMILQDKGVEVTCRVTHDLGHSESSVMQVPFGTKTAIMSDSQVTAAAQTFAKRYAFCNAFGILTGGDEDTDAALREPMKPYVVPRVILASDDEPQGKRFAYPKHDDTNDAHPLKDLDKPETDKNVVIILELLSELGKPADTPRIAKMHIKMLTGGLSGGITWDKGTNDEDVIEALRKLNVERMNHE